MTTNSRGPFTVPIQDLWGDNHCALDQRSIDLSIIYTRLKAAGYPLWLQVPPFGGAHIYYQDPSGWQIQLNGVFTNPPADAWKYVSTLPLFGGLPAARRPPPPFCPWFLP